WAVLPAYSIGSSKTVSEATQLEIILKKLRYPKYSGEQIVTELGLKCDRNVVNLIVKHWGIEDKSRGPVDLQQYLGGSDLLDREVPKGFVPIKTSVQLVDEEELLKTRRQNRHFELIAKKMKRFPFHICDPGPILLAPLVSGLGIIQAFETYGPLRLRGKEISNLALLNVMRILSGYRHINHLSDNKDRSVAVASGIGMFGTRSKF
ncbi:MAG: hypothetical protein K940chlam7_00021, partial [Chlamydiae bacterium]|nr:hypothetical protein [Chlamydiota bacterium]